MKRIVVGIDGSEQGWAALAKAGELARATGAELQVAYVSPPITSLFASSEFKDAAPAWRADQEERATALLREAVARVEEGVSVEAVNRIGLPAEALAELAQDPEVSMTVVGHRERSLPARLLMGSVADHLVQISPKPVLVIR